MTSEDVQQEIDWEPYLPLRLHLASGRTIDLPYPNTAWIRQNTLVVVFPLERNTHRIGNYDVVALRLIEHIEQIGETSIA